MVGLTSDSYVKNLRKKINHPMLTPTSYTVYFSKYLFFQPCGSLCRGVSSLALIKCKVCDLQLPIRKLNVE